MNIMFYMPDPSGSKNSGMNTHIYEVLGNLYRMGHVIRYANGSTYTPSSGKDDVPTNCENQQRSRLVRMAAASPVKGETWLFWNLLKEIKTFFSAGITAIQHRPDVIYRRQSHFASDYFIASLFNIPLVKEFNTLGSDELAVSGRVDKLILWIYRAMERFNYPRASKIIVVTPELKKLLQSEYGIEPDKIMVIQNGANTELFKPIDMYYARAELMLSSEYRYICFVGNLMPWQGLDYLIRSLPVILENCPQARLLIVGDGPMKAELIALANDIGVQEETIFTGSIPYENVPLYINASNICVLRFVRKLNEKIGLSPLKLHEYLACGKPVVSSNLAGIIETLEAADAGITVPPEDPERIAEAILNLLQNDKLRNRMSENGRKYVVENQSWQKVSERVEGVLYSSISQKGSSNENKTR